jgi:hypothetical protein
MVALATIGVHDPEGDDLAPLTSPTSRPRTGDVLDADGQLVRVDVVVPSAPDSAIAALVRVAAHQLNAHG